jgi:hypothetical protein
MSTNKAINYSEYYKNRLQKHDVCFEEIINKIPKTISIYRKKRDYKEAFSQIPTYTRFSDINTNDEANINTNKE